MEIRDLFAGSSLDPVDTLTASFPLSQKTTSNKTTSSSPTDLTAYISNRLHSNQIQPKNEHYS